MEEFVLFVVVSVVAYWLYTRSKHAASEEHSGKPRTGHKHTASNAFAELMHLIEQQSEDWDVIRNTPDLQVLKKYSEDSPIAIIKAKVLIPNTVPKQVFEALWDEAKRQAWDEVLKGLQVLEKIDEFTEVTYMYVDSPLPILVANREFIQKRKYREVNGSYLITYKSIPRNDIPVREGWVRANTILSGYWIKPSGPDVELHFISQNDIKGKIPPKLINAIAPKKTLDWVKKLRRVCAQQV